MEHPMRGLLMAYFAIDFAGRAAGGRYARVHSTKTTAKTTIKTV
jgi:hypothetical protein